MVDFTNLEAYNVTKNNLMEFPLVELGDAPVLTLRSATEGNSGYMNGLLRATGQTGGVRRKKLEVDADLMDETRAHDRLLYADHVITGWSGVFDAQGNEVKYSLKAAREFMQVLPAWIFDRIRTFATDPENFVVKIDSVAKAKNSQKG